MLRSPGVSFFETELPEILHYGGLKKLWREVAGAGHGLDDPLGIDHNDLLGLHGQGPIRGIFEDVFNVHSHRFRQAVARTRAPLASANDRDRAITILSQDARQSFVHVSGMRKDLGATRREQIPEALSLVRSVFSAHVNEDVSEGHFRSGAGRPLGLSRLGIVQSRCQLGNTVVCPAAFFYRGVFRRQASNEPLGGDQFLFEVARPYPIGSHDGDAAEGREHDLECSGARPQVVLAALAVAAIRSGRDADCRRFVCGSGGFQPEVAG
mmetsp:Transcript_14712/g.33799  ORF Transcript_14712/g.33799 Transcript_14712/m.33799 type:complete len:267 (-) Transcript_14712:547-1347(-)